jgi:hypothetical protein
MDYFLTRDKRMSQNNANFRVVFRRSILSLWISKKRKNFFIKFT